jgi:hypothetical protein
VESRSGTPFTHPQLEQRWSISLDMYRKSLLKVTRGVGSNHLRHFPGISLSAITAVLVVSFKLSLADASTDNHHKHHVKKCGLPNNSLCVENDDCESGLCLFDIFAQADICEPGPLVSASFTNKLDIAHQIHLRELHVSPRRIV